MPPVGPHDDTPTQAGKDRPRVPHDFCPYNLAHAPLFLDRQLGQSEGRSCKHVNDDLLIDATLNATTENSIATDESRKKRVRRGFLTRGGGGPEEEHGRFVNNRVRSEVASVLPGGFEDEVQFFT